MVGDVLDILMEHDFNILMIFGIKAKTRTMYCWLLLQIHLRCLWPLLCCRDTFQEEPALIVKQNMIGIARTCYDWSAKWCCYLIGLRRRWVESTHLWIASVLTKRQPLVKPTRTWLKLIHRLAAKGSQSSPPPHVKIPNFTAEKSMFTVWYKKWFWSISLILPFVTMCVWGGIITRPFKLY